MAAALRTLEHEVWFDEWEIFIGDSLVGKIDRGTDEADVILLLISAQSVQSGWVEAEWLPKFIEEIEQKHLYIIPARLDETPVPRMLRGRRYADLRGPWLCTIRDLSLALQPLRYETGITRVYEDFVNIPSTDWHHLLGQAESLDLFIMYSNTWRNTYRKKLEEILRRPEGRIRVILPSTEQSGSAGRLIALYASRMQVAEAELRERVNRAAVEFKHLERTAGAGSVEIYATSHAFQHALYCAESQCILALYALCGERIATPALLLEAGVILEFARRDLTGVLESQSGTERFM